MTTVTTIELGRAKYFATLRTLATQWTLYPAATLADLAVAS